MRPIDADEVKLPKGFFESVTTVPRFYGWLDTIPTIDAVPVVRCKDCKHFHYSKPYGILMMNLVCDKWGKGCRTNPDGYCFMGEREDDAVK